MIEPVPGSDKNVIGEWKLNKTFYVDICWTKRTRFCNYMPFASIGVHQIEKITFVQTAFVRLCPRINLTFGHN